jgi:hypothetical protein
MDYNVEFVTDVGLVSYDSIEECCAELIATESDADNAVCKYIDICNPTDEPTSSPTLAPVTPEPTSYVTATETPAPTTCEGRMFYIITDIDGEIKCSNGMTNSDSLMTSVGAYETVLDCCDKLIADGVADCNDKCKYIDICNPTLEPTLSPTPAPIEIIVVTPSPVTPAPTPCEGRKWYLTTSEGDGSITCTNGYDITSLGDGATIYDTFLECCEEEAMESMDSTDDCKYIDVCNPPVPTPAPIEIETPSPVSPAPTPCEGRKWYLTTSEGDGSITCTNGYDITSMGDGATIYDTFLECCEEKAMETGDNTDCKYIDVCNPPAPTPAPIEIVTFEPTVGSSIGSTPTVGKEMDILSIETGPRRNLE